MIYRVWLLFCILMTVQVYGQEISCSHYKSAVNQAFNKATVLVPEEEYYDVKYVKLDLVMNDTGVNISGSATTKAMVTANVMDAYVFELSQALTIDSVFINGIAQTIISKGDLRRIQLSPLFVQNDMFTAQVYYHGTPEKGNGFFTRLGLNQYKADPAGINVTYTLSEPYMSIDWWPCKQSLQDKIDSAAIWLTVPDSTKAGSNGLLKKITPMPGGMLRYEWHTQYPIAYYLLSAAVAKYKDYSYKVALPGVADSMQVQNFIYDIPDAMTLYKAGLDSTVQMLQYFSEVFGIYPFYKEKYGHCIAPLFGGMEHQTMSTCGNAGPGLIAHELAHQWFGDNVTCGTWRDIWLNEGFASYAEYLFYERYRGQQVADARMNSFHSNVLDKEDGNGTVYGDDTTNVDRIFSGRLSYNKPAAVLHMLRYEIANDSLFFAVLKTYQKTYANKTAITNEFLQVLNTVTKKDWTYFIDQWIYKQGAPAYAVEWNQLGDAVFLRLKQRATHPASVSLFTTSVDIKLIGDGVDTTVRVFNNTTIQDYKFGWGKPVKAIIVDPKNSILNLVDRIDKTPELGANTLISKDVIVFPNPTADKWVVVGVPKGASVYVADIAGRVVLSGMAGSNMPFTIDGSMLAKGTYMLQVRNGKDKIAGLKLIKQ